MLRLKPKAFGKKFTVALIAVLVISLLTPLSALADWNTFQNNNYHQGVVTSGTAPTSVSPTTNSLSLGASATFNGIDVEPLIANYSSKDYAYVLNTNSSDFRMYKIDLASHSQASGWSGGVQLLNQNNFQVSTPVIDGTTLYAGGTDATQLLTNPYFDSDLSGWTPVSGAGSPTIAWAASDPAGFSGGAKISQSAGGTATTGAVQQSQTFSTGMGQLNFYYVVSNTTGSAPTGINVNAQISTDGGSTWNTIYTNSSVTPGLPVYVTQDVTSTFSSSATYLVKFEANYTTAASSDGYAFFDTCALTNYDPFLKEVPNIDNSTASSASTVATITGGGQLNSPLTFDNGNIYAGVWKDQEQGAYYQVDVSSGTVTSLGGLLSGDNFYNAGAAVIPGNTTNYIVFGGEKSRIYVYDESDLSAPVGTYDIKGTGTGKEPTAGAIRSSITYDGTSSSSPTGHIYFTDTGGFLWKLNIDLSDGTLSHAWHKSIGASTSTPAFYNNNVYVGVGSFSVNGAVVSYDSTGTLRWTYTTASGGNKEPVQSSPVVYDNGTHVYIYFTTNDFDGAGYCIQDGASPSLIWQSPTSGGTYTAQGFGISNGYAVFGNDNGDAYIIQ